MKKNIIQTAVDKSGATILLTVLIVTSIITIITLAMGIQSINQQLIILNQRKSTDIFYTADACADEALINLERDNNYTGEQINYDNIICSIAIAGNGNNKTITVTADDNIWSRNITVETSLNPELQITSWTENPS